MDDRRPPDFTLQVARRNRTATGRLFARCLQMGERELAALDRDDERDLHRRFDLDAERRRVLLVDHPAGRNAPPGLQSVGGDAKIRSAPRPVVDMRKGDHVKRRTTLRLLSLLTTLILIL